MTNIIGFPINDPIALLLRNLKQSVGDKAWQEIGPSMEAMLAKHGQMPPISLKFAPPGFEKFSPNEREQIGIAVRNQLVEYGTLCRELVMADLAVALVENAQLKKRMAALEK